MKRVPRLIFWELTKRCNLACIHCRAEADDIDYSGELSTEQIKKVIDDIAEVANPILVLTGGEPLSRADLFEIGAYASSKGMPIALATNATLVDEALAKRIKDTGFRRVSISIDGKDAETHDSFRGVKGSFDDALRGARFLRDAGVEFQFNMSVAKRNVSQLDDVLALSESEGAKALHLFMLVPVGCGVSIADTEMISAEEYERVLNWFYERSKTTSLEFKATCAPHYYRIIRQRAKDEGRTLSVERDGMAAMTKGCLAGSGVCFISHRGDVQPCGYLPLKAGNVVDTPFRDIWEKSELLCELSDESRLKGKCGACEYKKVCAGCRARAYYASGDYMADEPYCIYKPKGSSNE